MTDPPTNERDFASLIKQHSRIINKVSYFYATDKLPFDDLRQEIYVNIWLGLSQFRGDSKMSTWIYRVSLNSCVSYFRKHKRHQSEYTSIDSIPEIYDLGIEKPDRLREMYNLINRLDRGEKALILLWLSDRKYDDIADIMGIPRNTVASRLHRIKEKLVKYSNE